ncbi:MAG: BatA domain-containing protein [Akkermansiaceae bacterium]
MFANPLGLLSLLAIPAILAIHFLQRKSITVPVSTLFLLERTQREAVSGRRFERLIPSVPLWMQILAVLLLAWFLSEPRFKKENSVQRVAIVVDASASMQSFKDEAISSLKKVIPDLKGRASTMELLLLPSTPGADRIYSGSSVEELLTALEEFTPTQGMIDPSYSLRLARSIVSNDGTVIYLTDTPAEILPFDAGLLAVGKPIDNVGFTGVSFEDIDGVMTFQAIVKNYGTSTAVRTWSLVTKGGKTEPRQFDIESDAFTTISAALPEGAEEIRLELNSDEFTLDDTLPMVAPKPKQLSLFASTSPAFKNLTDKLLRSLEATEFTNDMATSDLVVTSYDPLLPVIPESNAILFVEDPTSAGKYLKGGLIAESHPLMDGINWQALLVRETLELPRLQTDRVLLWQETRPLIFLRENGERQILCFNFDLRLSNATQQPAFIVLLHRFAESLRTRKVAAYSLNLETGQPISVATRSDGDIKISAVSTNGDSIAKPQVGRAPSLPGFFEISQNDEVILKAAVYFADTREADFSTTETAEFSQFSNTSNIELHTSPDPLARLWMLLSLVALLVAWYFTAGKKSKPEAVVA